jgi:hypothetical protein
MPTIYKMLVARGRHLAPGDLISADGADGCKYVSAQQIAQLVAIGQAAEHRAAEVAEPIERRPAKRKHALAGAVSETTTAESEGPDDLAG